MQRLQQAQTVFSSKPHQQLCAGPLSNLLQNPAAECCKYRYLFLFSHSLTVRFAAARNRARNSRELVITRPGTCSNKQAEETAKTSVRVPAYEHRHVLIQHVVEDDAEVQQASSAGPQNLYHRSHHVSRTERRTCQGHGHRPTQGGVHHKHQNGCCDMNAVSAGQSGQSESRTSSSIAGIIHQSTVPGIN